MNKFLIIALICQLVATVYASNVSNLSVSKTTMVCYSDSKTSSYHTLTTRVDLKNQTFSAFGGYETGRAVKIKIKNLDISNHPQDAKYAYAVNLKGKAQNTYPHEKRSIINLEAQLYYDRNLAGRMDLMYQDSVTRLIYAFELICSPEVLVPKN